MRELLSGGRADPGSSLFRVYYHRAWNIDTGCHIDFIGSLASQRSFANVDRLQIYARISDNNTQTLK